MKTLGRKLTLIQRIRLMVISGLGLCVALACSLWDRRDRKTVVTCYTPVPPSETPEVLCYEVAPPTPEEPMPTPTLLCYTATPSATPTPTPVAEMPETLLERLLVEDRFPEAIADQLKG